MPTALSTPSSNLPPLSKLLTFTAVYISGALDSLRQLYWPPHSFTTKFAVPTRKHLQTIHDDSVPDSGYASAEEESIEDEEEQLMEHGSEDEEAVEILRADPFERTFAIKWVTAFIARSDAWVIESGEDVDEYETRANVVEKAISILSAFNGHDDEEQAAQCALTRSFSFPSRGGHPDILVKLNDAPLSDVDHTSVGLQSWASSIVLAERMSAVPSVFMLERRPSARVLELGAGTGLLSITAAKILERQQRSSTQPVPIFHPVVATDYHPAVLSNLAVNISTNFSRSSPSSSEPGPNPVSVLRLDWESPDYSSFEGQRFDVILAADVIYHPHHSRWIKACVERLLTRPSSESDYQGGYFWLIMPLRTTGRHENLDHTVEETFPDASVVSSGDIPELAVLERESFVKQGGVGRADESGYKLFKIGWVGSW
ncbi:hypothetical protein E1B28_001862 [Marasmius oreades]|uniref:S-adenosylmethionine-dependent methyltransferase n=1 Tax=Marasmius oreades TaxID=181124 RepID=A0A9P8AFW2_9AGAR|nr:uncharacterized protein E1B28_001862 [Marasmius oreades]KAG7100079.1 hypothetical protein E1B28_001862 [Marasmius oreades]